MKFFIEKSNLTGQKGELFLKSDKKHCHLLASVQELLKSSFFRDNNPELIPIYEKAVQMMEQGEVGNIN